MNILKSLPRPVAAALLLCLLVPGHALAELRPLPVDGVEGLEQRVLTRPAAALRTVPDVATGAPLPTFSVFYVFERKDVGGAEWLHVGPGRLKPPTGWLPANETVPWKQAVTLSFNQNPARPPVLFFDRRESLETVLSDPRRGERMLRMIEVVRSGAPAEGYGVAAVEPQPVADFATSFYLLPILEAEDVALTGLRRRGGMKIVKIASLALPPPEEPEEGVGEFATGIVFVIDTTMSMDPYIERTRLTVKRIMERLHASSLGDRISFDLVGFRDNLEGRAGLGYVSRVYHPLRKDFDAAGFERALAGMKAATESSSGFAEDGLAGVQTALNMKDWKHFAGRFIIFVTDAPVRGAEDPRSATHISPSDLATSAGTADRHTAIFSLFLQTPQGTEHHGRALAQLSELSRFGPTRNSYVFAVPEGDVAGFGDRIDHLVDDLVTMTESAGASSSAPSAVASSPSPVFEAGYAMRLAWLASRRGTRAPQVREAWAADFDPTDPRARKSFNVNVLLTRNQLNDLYQAFDALVQAANMRLDAAGGAASFFSHLRNVLARAQTDPATLRSLDPSVASRVPTADEVDSLQDLVGSWVRHLPYHSPLLAHRREDLESLSPHAVNELLVQLRSKMAMYQNYFADVDRWVKLNPAAGLEDAVYPVPLELMP